MYPDPDAFKPERFLNPDGSLRDDPLLSSAFGYGKRKCPGRHLVDETLFIYAASLLSVFCVESAQGDQEKGSNSESKFIGSLLRYTHQFSSGNGERKLITSSYPESCLCSITPRGKWAEQLIVADTMVR